MLYFPRTLALVVGLAGPVAGFASIKDGNTLIDVVIEGAGKNYKRPDLKCCPDINGALPEGCNKIRGRIDECLPDDLCLRIGADTTSPGDPAGTIQEGPDWCNAAVSKLATNEEKKEACSGGKILRKQKDVMTKNGHGVEFLVCAWDDTEEEGKCVLAGWSLRCPISDKYFTEDKDDFRRVIEGCPGVTPVELEPVREARAQSGEKYSDVILATKCSNKMEKSSLSFNANGSPRYTRAMSCAQKLLDCGGDRGVRDPTLSEDINRANVNNTCNTQRGVTWDDCCRGSRRFRELKEEDQEQTAPADEKRKSRNLQATTPEAACEKAGGSLYKMTNGGKCCDNKKNTVGEPINVFGDQPLYKEISIVDREVGLVETCEYKPSSGGGDKCECKTEIGTTTDRDNCLFPAGGNLVPWG